MYMIQRSPFLDIVSIITILEFITLKVNRVSLFPSRWESYFLVSITLKKKFPTPLGYNGKKGVCSLEYQYYEKIREVREDRGYTQQQIADYLKIGQRTYSDYETGRTRIPLESVIALAKFFDLDLNYLTGISQVKRPYPKK